MKTHKWFKSLLGVVMMGAAVLTTAAAVSGISADTVYADTFDLIVPDADIRYMTDSEVQNWSLQTLCYAKNEIYARRGWIFRSNELNDYFGRQSWYIGRLTSDQFTEAIMNVYEIENAKLLQKWENAKSGNQGYKLDQYGYNFDAVYYDLYGTPFTGTFGDGGYILPGSDTYYLSESEIADLTWQELCYARNEIYARHGRMFRSTELTNYFNTKNWYVGMIDPSSFSDSVLNTYETANVNLMYNYENNVYGAYNLDQPGYTFEGVRSIGGYTPYDPYASYVPSQYVFPDSDCRYLSESEVSVYSAQMLCYAKNEIYARHGRMFDSQELRDYFGSLDWYYGWVQPNNFSDTVFNAYELANIKLLQKYEYKYAPGGYSLY